MHGQGLYTWQDGRKYEGDYYNDKKHGFGIYTWADGRQYHGMWKDGKQHGEGKYILPSGVQRRGQWRDGVREKWLDQASQAQSSTAATSPHTLNSSRVQNNN